jgi:hypothetical protein
VAIVCFAAVSVVTGVVLLVYLRASGRADVDEVARVSTAAK